MGASGKGILNDRACGHRTDWIRSAPSNGGGLQRIVAYFAGHAYDSHRHDTYAIGCTLSGVQSFDYRGARVDSKQGDVMVIHPDERHDGRAGSKAGFFYCMLYIEPRLIRLALGDRATALPFAKVAASPNRRLGAALLPVFDDLDRVLEPVEADQLVVHIADALLELDNSLQRRPVAPVCALAVERARQFLSQHASRTVTSEELEAVSGLDRYTLARQFRTFFATSPYRYLTLRRLDRARSRISRGESLSDVALECGFADQSHMTRHFKNAYGLTPGRWQTLCDGHRSSRDSRFNYR